MKTLEHQTLLYDDNCPLCRVYTKGFISAGMLDENGKRPYCQLSEDEQVFIDLKRAANEIALVDTKNKTVLYGIDSLLKVIGNSFPWMAVVGEWQPVNYFLKKLYKFISFNRKVIVPSIENKKLAFNCVPDFNVKYRWFYIFFVLLVASFFDFKAVNHFGYNLKIYEIWILHAAVLIPNFLLVFKYDFKFFLNWLGNFATSLMLFSVGLLSMVFIDVLFKIPNMIFSTIYYLIIAFLLFDILRRFRIAKANV